MNQREQKFFDAFVERMRGEFEANKVKGDWSAIGVCTASLELDHHVQKFTAAAVRGDRGAFLEALADVANSACIMAAAYGLLDEGAERPPYVEPEYDLDRPRGSLRYDY